MIVPQMQMRYCVYCHKHTEHILSKVGVSKKKSTLAHGQRIFKRKMKGFGSFPKPNPRGRAKPTRKVDLRYKCKVCGKQHVIGVGFRVKKFEFQKGE